jgi:hypothetical protein
MYPCGVVEEAEARREQDAAVRHWIWVRTRTRLV